jgi:glycerophosphoryl diester phosphodiesterase
MTNPYQSPKGQPLIYGHRGARGVLPENTMPGFDYLRTQRVPGVEIDVQLTADGQAVIIHDPRIPAQIARDGRGAWLAAPGPKVRDLTLEQVQAYDLGRLNPAHPYAGRYPDQQPADGARVPTLAEFLDWAKADPDLVVNIEIKSFADHTDLGTSPEILARSVVDALVTTKLSGPCVVSSFDWRVLGALARLAPQFARGYLTLLPPDPEANIHDGSDWMDGLRLSDHGGSLPHLIAAQGAACWCPYFRDITQQDVHLAQSLGLAVNVWTVNEQQDLQSLIAMGVDGIITDYPLRAMAEVARSV